MADELDIANTLIGNRTGPAEALLEPGAAFGPYRIERAIGSGGMGAVYLARAADGERVALKVIRPELADAAGRERMIAEGTQARKVRHPNVVRVDTVGSVGDRLYLSMEYVDGRPLRAFMTEHIRSALNLPAIAAVMHALLDGLGEVHANGLVHRDIKPENVIVAGTPGEPGFVLKIVDFGIARAAGGRTSTAASAIGAPLYMAPEQRTRPDDVDPSADVYSLGRMLYEMLMGVLPEGMWSPPSATEPGVPPALDEVIRKAIAVPPKARFQSAREFRAAFDAALGFATPKPRADDKPASVGPPDLPQDTSGGGAARETAGGGVARDPTAAAAADREAARLRQLAADLGIAPGSLPAEEILRRHAAKLAQDEADRSAAEASARQKEDAARRAAEADARAKADAKDAALKAKEGGVGRVLAVVAVLVLCAGGAVVALMPAEQPDVTPSAGTGGTDPAVTGIGDVGLNGINGITGNNRINGLSSVLPPEPPPPPPPPAAAAPGGIWYDRYDNAFTVTVTGDQVHGVGYIQAYGPVTLAGSVYGTMQLTTQSGMVLATFANGTVDGSHWTGMVYENGASYQGQLHFNHLEQH